MPRPVSENVKRAGRRALELRDEGMSWRLVADTLTSEGFETASGGKWYPNTARRAANAVAAPVEAPPKPKLEVVVSEKKPAPKKKSGPNKKPKLEVVVTKPFKPRPTSPDELEAAIIADLESLVVTQGQGAGETFTVLDWERKLVHGLVHNTEVALSIARGNGKTTFVAGLGCSALDGALTLPRGQVAIVASSRDQANIAFDHIWYFMQEKFEAEPRRWRSNRNNQFSVIECRKTGMHVKVYGSDANRAHGLAPSLLILDEPAKWKGGGRAMYAACVTSLGKQTGAKQVALGTRPEDEDHWFSEMLDSADVPDIWVQEYKPSMTPDHPDWDDFDMAHILAANPSYGFMPDLAREIHRLAGKAARGGNDLSMFRALRLNLGTPETMDHQPIVNGDDWRALMGEPVRPRSGPVFVGIDLGGGTSMSCVAFNWPETGRLEVYGALPAQPSLLERGKLDFVGKRYQAMYDRGELRTYPGKATNNRQFLEDVFADDLGPDEEILGVAADRYKQEDTEQSSAAAGFLHTVDFRPVGRGPTGSQDIIAFRQEVAEARINMPGESLMLNSSIKESRVGYDENNNPGLLKKRFKGRNDPLAASLLAVGQGRRWRLPSKKPGVYGVSNFIVTPETVAIDEGRNGQAG